MGGGAPQPAKKGGKKSLDNEMNLVPFIDLLSCLISFLLITAVWTQISAVDARSTGNLSKNDPPPADDPTVAIRVTLTQNGYLLSVAGQLTEIPKTSVNGKLVYDTKSLTDQLKAVKAAKPQQRAVTIAAEDTVAYEDLAVTMDQVAGPSRSATGGDLMPELTVAPST